MRDDLFSWPWTPTASGSDDGDYGPDQLVTCQDCGATIDARPGTDAEALHRTWHEKIKTILGGDTDA